MERGDCQNCGGSEGIHHYLTDECPVGGKEAPVNRKQEYKTSTYKPPAPAPSTVDVGLRDHFAGAALTGVLAFGIGKENLPPKAAAKAAYEYADAMLEARK